MRAKSNGFTLIELLVVIAIIAVLLAVMVPALKEAKERSKVVVCGAHLHQVGLAIAGYSFNNNDHLVPGNFWNGTTIYNSWSAAGWNGPVNVGILIGDAYLPFPTNNSYLLHCPSVRYDWYDKGFQGRWGFPNQTVDMTYDFRDSMDGGALLSNQYIPNSHSGKYKGVSMAKIGSRASIIMDAYVWGWTRACHKRKYNIVFGDASVRMYNDRIFQDQVYTPNDPREIGFTNYVESQINRDEMAWHDSHAFDIIDLLTGGPYWRPPAIGGEPEDPVPFWRQ